jgi:hypothetical protein
MVGEATVPKRASFGSTGNPQSTIFPGKVIRSSIIRPGTYFQLDSSFRVECYFNPPPGGSKVRLVALTQLGRNQLNINIWDKKSRSQ